MRPNTRNRRNFGTCGGVEQYEIHASEGEIAKDLQQLYQCSFPQVSPLLLTDTEPDPSLSIRSKVPYMQRKRTVSGKDSDYLDAVLGLATFVTEGEGPINDRKSKPSIIKNAKAEPAPKPQPKPSPVPKSRPKASSPPQIQRKPPSLSPSPPPSAYYPPYSYPFLLPNYMFPMDKTPQAGLGLIPSFAMGTPMAPGMYTHPFGVMYPQNLYGKTAWPVAMPQSGAVQGRQGGGNVGGKRAGRHVAIAVFIREEEKKRKEGAAPAKTTRLI